ncbi:MAG: hypothetical protein FWG50_12340 [Kiritimatiellaeota bacterium]|nr:hypothetical protein [Kiritimatiellota bacterium]
MSDTFAYLFLPCVAFTYDGFGRVSRTDHYPLTTGHYFYVWGLDLNGQAGGRASPRAEMQGAGVGVGLLAAMMNRTKNKGKNCQGDVQDAMADCCLTGWSTFVSKRCAKCSGDFWWRNTGATK